MSQPDDFQAFHVPDNAPLPRVPADAIFRVPGEEFVITILSDDNVIVIEN